MNGASRVLVWNKSNHLTVAGVGQARQKRRCRYRSVVSITLQWHRYFRLTTQDVDMYEFQDSSITLRWQG